MLSILVPFACAACGAVAPQRICARCTSLGPPLVLPKMEGIQLGVAAGSYDGPIGEALRRAKSTRDRSAAIAVSELVGKHLAAWMVGADLIVPAPTTPWRRARRGFHPAAILGRTLASEMGIPCRSALASRRGSSQSELGPRGRRQNMVGRIRGKRAVQGTVLLVDDVVTTGATVEACTRELLANGAAEVWCAALCYSILDPI